MSNDDLSLNESETKVLLMLLLHGGKHPAIGWQAAYHAATGGVTNTELKSRGLMNNECDFVVLTPKGRKAIEELK